MRNIFLASAAAATLVAGLGAASASAQPGGPQGAWPPGSYSRSCRTATAANGILTAECLDPQGRYHVSSIPFGQCRGDLSNQSGMLTCPGAQGSGGQIVSGAPGSAPRNNSGAVAAGVVAGAILGGALAGGGPPVVYGDPHYGDPRFDPHYAQGGWGYGHRPGEWVPIRDRADWLDQRIDRAQRDGRISRGDARDLRRQLGMIEDMEARFMRDGRIDGRERADLDNRFDQLSRRISYDAGGPPGPPPGYDPNRR